MNVKELEKGTELKERYQIKEILGRGGFSITYLATDQLLNVPVALKQYDMSKSLTGNEAKREAQLAAVFYDLDGIAAARDYFEEQGIFFIVMEYVDGINMSDYVKRHGSMSGQDVLEKMRPILQSLSHIHEKGVIHRDISADNLILSADGKLKLIDFGAARQQITDGTQRYTMIYKRGFAPIEQCQSHGTQGPWTDVYAVCSTMYFMLTGVVPDDAVDRMIQDRVRPLEEFAGTGLRREDAAVIMKGMAVERKNRYASVLDLYFDLYGEKLEQNSRSLEKRWGDGEVHKKKRQSTTYLANQVKRFYKVRVRKRKRLLAAACVLFLLLGTGLFLWKHTSAENPAREPEADKQENRTTPAETVTNRSTESPVSNSAVPTTSPEKPEKVEIKNYKGRSQNAIRKELKRCQKEGLKLHIVKKYSKKKKGTVLSQKPAPGRRYDSWKGVTLTLTISKGEKPISVPTPKPEKRSPKKEGSVTFHGSLDGL